MLFSFSPSRFSFPRGTQVKLSFCFLVVALAFAQPPINDTGVELPTGCKPILFYRGVGTQDYVCSDPTNSGTLKWNLVEPHATLHTYVGSLLNYTIDGYHFFTTPGVNGQVGSGAGWRLGSQCGFYGCSVVTDEFLGGAAAKTAPQPGTIPWLLVPKKEASGPKFQDLSYAQRLATVGGVPPVACAELGDTYNAAYEADYVFSICPSK